MRRLAALKRTHSCLSTYIYPIHQNRRLATQHSLRPRHRPLPFPNPSIPFTSNTLYNQQDGRQRLEQRDQDRQQGPGTGCFGARDNDQGQERVERSAEKRSGRRHREEVLHSKRTARLALHLHNDTRQLTSDVPTQASNNPEGQRLTKVDRADGPVATKKVPEDVAKALAQARNNLKNQKGGTMTQKDLASKANVDVKYVTALERTGADFPPMDAILKLQKAANVRLTGNNIGEPMLGPKKK